MSWVAVAIGGSAVIGGVVSSKNAGDATDAAKEAEAAQLDFAKQQYADWKAIYGPMEQNLANYYNNLTPEHYEAIGLEAVSAEYDTLQQNMQRTLAQRGITDSGVGLALEQEAGIAEAEARADVRRSSDAAVAQEKMGFLGMGMGANPAQSISQTLSQHSAGARDRANAASAAAGQAWGSAISTVGTGLSDYFAGNKPGGGV